MFRNKNKMHFVGIGGVGMSGIAEILINLGYEVSGSDLRPSDYTNRLEKLGAKIYIGHSKANIGDYSVVVTSTAIDPNNPEIIEARIRKIPIIHRSEMLAHLVRLKHGIGVAGTHGKTTTTSLMSSVLWHCGVNPTAIVGGKVLNFGSNAKIGGGDYIVFEADESDGTFLKLLPSIGVVTNIDADHLDYYKYFEGLKTAFLTYMNSIPFYGYSVICIDDPVIRELSSKIEKPFFTYGFSQDADFRAENVRIDNMKTVFSCYYRNKYIEDFSMHLMGKHNVLNCLSVITVGFEMGLKIEDIKKGIEDFQGVGRRLELIGKYNDISVYDDYGHHPTEIKATLNALKNLNRRIVAVFQPHRYSRTELLWDEFGKAFPDADEVIFTEIYPAGESAIEGISTDLIAGSYKKHSGKDAIVVRQFGDISQKVVDIVRNGDIIVTLGAGDIYKTGHIILDLLREKGV